MAETKQEVVIDINIEQDDGAFKKLADLKGTLVGLKTEQKQLEKALKDGIITQKEYNSEIVRVEALQKKASAQYNETQRSVTGLKNPLIEINDSLKKQTELLGGATPALDKLTGGAASATQGIFGMVKASLAFIATPIGAVIAALGIVIGALTAYFKGSEEGQNRLNKIMSVGSVIMEKVMDIAENLGEAIFNAFENPKKALTDLYEFIKGNLINRFTALSVIIEGISTLDFKKVGNGILQLTTGVENVIDKVQNLGNEIIATANEAIKQGTKLADLQAKIDRDERALIVERARISLEVSKLRSKAVEEEGEIKRKTIEQAIALETALSDKEVALAKTRLANAKLMLEANGADKEALSEVAKATAAVSAAEEQRFSATLRFQKEIERLREEDLKEQQRIEAEQEKNNEEVRERLKKEREEQAKIEAEQEANNQRVRDENLKKAAQKEIEVEKIKNAAVGGLINKLTKNRIDGQQLYTTVFKKGALAETYANTKAAAIAAYKSLATIPIVGPALGVIAGAAATAYGLSQALGIQALTFARGGIANNGGVLNGPSHARGGIPFSVGGRVGFEAEGGEAIINKRSTALFRRELSAINKAGGGVEFATGGVLGNETRIATQQAQSQFDINQMASLLNMVQTVLVLEQFEAKQDSVNQIKRTATVIG